MVSEPEPKTQPITRELFKKPISKAIYAMTERTYFIHPMICKALFFGTDDPVILNLASHLILRAGMMKLDERGLENKFKQYFSDIANNDRSEETFLAETFTQCPNA